MSAMIPDLYGPSHKAIRLAVSDFLVLAGQCDASDPAAWTRVEAGGQRIQAILDAHSLTEDAYVHPMLRLAAPDVALALDARHAALGQSARRVGAELRAIGRAQHAEKRRQAARDVCLAFSTFLSDYLEHQIEEETRAMPALVAHYAPPALFAANRALLASLPLDKRLADLPIIARALAPRGRIGLMLGALESAPHAFLADASRILQATIGAEAFAPVAETVQRQAA